MSTVLHLENVLSPCVRLFIQSLIDEEGGVFPAGVQATIQPGDGSALRPLVVVRTEEAALQR
ncbi:MAG TPA: hypothetical protein VLT90_14095 [Terriglobales bacterium]|nr:hypothetical protein [Terriglobales bacterium]